MQSKVNIGLVITGMFLLAVTAFFMVNVEMPSWASYVSGFSILVFLIPGYIASVRWIGTRDTIILFAVLGFYALIFESLAVSTGFPYGRFSYSGELGRKIFGIVPWTVAFAWTPLLLAAYALANKLFSNLTARVAAITALLVVFDLVLDPGAVKMGFWEFAEKGWYYDVPASNFLGWILSGAIGALLFEAAAAWFKPLLPVPLQMTQSGFLIIFYWTCAAIFSSMYIPAMIGFGVLLFVAFVYSKHQYSFDDMVVLVDDENRAIGTAPKLPIHNDRTPLHRAFSVFLFNRKGELLLQRRAEHKKTWGGVWSNSCCGHVMLHEPVERAAKRRLRYELGLKGITLINVLPDYRYRAEKDGIVENEFCPVLVGFVETDPKINPLEVAEFEWMPWDEFLAQANEPETDFSPWAVEEAQLLSENDEFKRILEKFTK